ncbi:hypothetical protein J6590_104457 [Homalodisca vitripennis]|nr:hypothetical protein J6590_104457 [Homalodisca vitripennis]
MNSSLIDNIEDALFLTHPFSNEELSRAFRQMRCRKAPGLDGFSAKMLQSTAADECVKPLHARRYLRSLMGDSTTGPLK